MVAKSPEGIGANVKIFLGHFQKCLTVKNQDFGENFKKEPEKVAGSYFL